MSNFSQPHGLQPTRFLHPWDFPGKSTGVVAIAFSNDKPRQCIKRQRQYFANKGLYSQSYGFSGTNVHMWECRSIQLLSHVLLFATPWTVACQASLSITNSQSLLKLMSIGLVMPSNHFILCHPLRTPWTVCELYHKEGWAPKNRCFWIVVLEKSLECPSRLLSKEIKSINQS